MEQSSTASSGLIADWKTSAPRRMTSESRTFVSLSRSDGYVHQDWRRHAARHQSSGVPTSYLQSERPQQPQQQVPGVVSPPQQQQVAEFIGLLLSDPLYALNPRDKSTP